MLKPRFSDGASVTPIGNGWRLQIPPGSERSYRLAQLDDYSSLRRGHFPLVSPTTLGLRCRVSDSQLPGTWGFGLWNDPFSFSLGMNGATQRLPVLPNACWFFHASQENHLSFHNHLPGNGFLAQTFRSPKIPSALLAPGLLAFPLFFSGIISKWIRALTGKIIGEDGTRLALDVTQWHAYSLTWRESGVAFSMDGKQVFETPISPQGPLGLVIWIDNQYAAWTPQGRIGMGTLHQNSAGWMEIEKVEVS